MINKPKIYLAAPLFNQMELDYNKSLKQTLSSMFSVFLPQEDGLLLRDLVQSGMHQDVAAKLVFEADLKAMNEADLILAILHGAHIDEGVAFELGYCFAQGKRCIALQEDARQALPIGNNPMISQSCEITFRNRADLLDWFVDHYPINSVSNYLKAQSRI